MTGTPTKDRSLEDELHELVESEAALEGRTNSLALTNILSFLFAFFAFAASIIALLVAVSNNNDDNGPAWAPRRAPRLPPWRAGA